MEHFHVTIATGKLSDVSMIGHSYYNLQCIMVAVYVVHVYVVVYVHILNFN